jgi:predicted  nucleic acid-binding Zn-ribbon protein
MVTDNTNKLRSQLSQLEDEIDKLHRERDEQTALVAQMREQVADYNALIERLTEAFAKLKVDYELLLLGGGDEVKYSRRRRRKRKVERHRR